ncbi:MAG TPA: LLM class flavin-dependent oxidoreductase [Ilumatobacteraceae bacterium]|nr:LLM class flavin-dependent oxidoreductase [Ilumatobacteraceae bacterium]
MRTTSSVEFSLWPSLGQPWADVVGLVQRAERQRWTNVYLADHFMGDGNSFGVASTPMLEATAGLAALAATTSRLGLGSLVFGITYRHPAVLANWAATTDIICAGRLILGVGAGWQVNEHEQYGIPLGSPGQRIDRFDEACQVIVSLLSEPATTFAGQYFHLDQALCEPKPVQRPLPLLVGGRGDRMLRVVARLANRWNIWSTPDAFAERSAALDRACEAIDRDPTTIRRSTQALWFTGISDADADRAIAAVAPRAAIGGSVQRMIDTVGAWRAAGVDEVIVPDFNLGAGTQRSEALEQIISEVAPAFT